MAEAYSAGDYAGITGGGYSFYYGYERTNGNDEWLFVVIRNGKELASWTARELKADQFDDPMSVLAKGVARFLDLTQSLRDNAL